MAGSKFTDEQMVEIRSMKMLEKKKTSEVMEHFKTKYGIVVNYTDISKICGPRKKSEKAPQVRKPRKQAKKISPEPQGEDDLMQAVCQLDGEIKAFCSRVRNVARREIIKYIARIRKARVTMGETISKEETERLEEQLKEFDIDPKEVKEVGL